MSTLEISPASCSGRDEFLDRRYDGTCQWIFGNDQYKSWMEERSPSLLWVLGIPGSGKSVLSSYLSGKLAISQRTSLVACFFCDNSPGQLSTAAAILSNLLQNILEQAPELIQHIPEYHLSQSVSKAPWGFAKLWEFFEGVVTNHDAKEIFCIVDGLDRCEEQSQRVFLEKLERLFGRPYRVNKPDRVVGNLKMIITSRPHTSPTDLLVAINRISLHENNTGDIIQFVEKEVEILVNEKKLPSDLRDAIKDYLLKGADGMFLWVSLTLSELRNFNGTSEESIRNKLEQLPKDVIAVYRSILGSIKDKDQAVARRILQWVTYALRPLSVPELKTVIALRSDDKSISSIKSREENNLERFLWSIFGPLLKIDHGSVHFIHRTAKDFLESQLSTQPIEHSLPSLDIPPNESNLQLAIDCLTYLSLEEFKEGPLSFVYSRGLFKDARGREDTGDHEDAWDHEYEWNREGIDCNFGGDENYSNGSNSSAGSLADGVTGNCQHPQSFCLKRRKYPLLSYAASFWPEHASRTDEAGHTQRLWKLFSKLARSEAKINSAYQMYLCSLGRQSHFVSTGPLQIAAHIAPPSIVRLLLETDSDLQSDAFTTALMSCVSQRGFQNPRLASEVALILLKYGAEVTQDILKEAAVLGDGELLELLLTYTDNRGVTELMMVRAAYWSISAGCLALLLKGNGQITREVMAAATRSSKREILALLLSRNGEITEEVMIEAARNQKGEEVLKLLLDRGGRITQDVMVEAARNPNGKGALGLLLIGGGLITEDVMVEAASNVAHAEEILGLLLKWGGQITEEVVKAAARNRDGKKPLELLLRSNRYQITNEVMLAAAKNPDGRKILKLLLRRDGKVTETVMVEAARSQRNKTILELLLDSDGKITEMVMAAAARNPMGKSILEFFLCKGGRVTEEVLVAAAGRGKRMEVFELLLNNSPQITERVMVEAVSYECDKNLIELLLGRGGQITEGVLVAAASSWDGKAVMELLLGKHSSRITEEIMVAAVSRNHGRNYLASLLTRWRIPISKKFLEDAVSKYNGRDILEWLLGQGGEVTERVMITAACSSNMKNIQDFLLERHCDIDEEVITDIKKNHLMIPEYLELLLERGGTISDKVLQSAMQSDWLLPWCQDGYKLSNTSTPVVSQFFSPLENEFKCRKDRNSQQNDGKSFWF